MGETCQFLYVLYGVNHYLHTDIILLQTNSTTYMNKSNQSQAIKTSGYQQKTLKPLGFSQNFLPLQNLNFIMKKELVLKFGNVLVLIENWTTK